MNMDLHWCWEFWCFWMGSKSKNGGRLCILRICCSQLVIKQQVDMILHITWVWIKTPSSSLRECQCSCPKISTFETHLISTKPFSFFLPFQSFKTTSIQDHQLSRFCASGISSIFSKALIKASPPKAEATRKSCAVRAVGVSAYW